MAAAIDKLLRTDPSFARAHIGIEVADLATGEVLYAHDEQQLFIPASNTKLLTTTAAFAILGPAWKTRTTVESAQAIDNKGDLDADLVLVGRGDPNLSGRVLPYNGKTERVEPPLKPLEALADQLVAAGLKRIKGDILGDDTWFAYERWGDSWGQDDLMWDYGAPISALTINDNVMYVTITPGTFVGALATVSAQPLVESYVIENHVTTAAADSEKHLGIDRQPGSTTIKLWGTVPIGIASQGEALSMEDPAAFAAAAFRNMLIARGVKVDGIARPQHTDATAIPPSLPEGIDATIPRSQLGFFTLQPKRLQLAVLESHPLGDDLKVINKVSQNLHVEILMRQLGREASPNQGSAIGGSVWGGTNVVRRFLVNEVGLPPDQFQYNDGSGMTPHNLVTPAMMVKLLLWARTQSWGADFLDTLPISAQDGSLTKRFLNTPTAGRVHAKTGTLNEVAALSGYATRLNGEEIAFSVLVNNEKIEKVTSRLIDAIVRTVVETRTR
ncbi:MAG: D-alanyl-D-alanine carboxypeptidase/D-alanyl-D-alanine-endopeptidase [Acidobacteriaceae bacterium]